MPPNRYGKLGVIALLSMGGTDVMAQAMPALRVDPALLGQTAPAPVVSPPVSPPVATPMAPITPVDPVASAPVSTPAPAKAVAPAVIAPAAVAVVTPVKPSAPEPVRPVTKPDSAAASVPVATVMPSAVMPVVRPPFPARAASQDSSPATKLPPLRVDPALLGPAPTAYAGAGQDTLARVASIAPCIPVAVMPAEMSAQVSVTNKLPPLRVDPALLGGGSAAVARAPTPASVIDCAVAPATLLAAAPGRLTDRSGKAGTALSQLPKGLPRIPVGNPDETVILADVIRGSDADEFIAEGNVQLTKDGTMLESDLLVYRQSLDELEATGNVRFSKDTEQVTGPHMKMQVKAQTGYFDQPSYVIQRSMLNKSKPSLFVSAEPAKPTPVGRGSASLMTFEGDGQYRLNDATYSTCTPNTDGSLDWYAKVADLKLDYNDAIGVGNNTTIYFKDTPILYAPWINFPLDNQRKSGLLTPSIGTSTRTGLQYTQPIYWNIAPNMDATFSPRVMSKRGVQMQTEFRYLEPSFAGQAKVEYLPSDKQYGEDRTAFAMSHVQNFGNGFSGSLNLIRVSDDDYFSDLGNRLRINSQNAIAVATPNNLLNQATLNYGASWWSATLLAQQYQTLGDVAEPYQRLPQLNITAARADLPVGLQFNFAGEVAYFSRASSLEYLDSTLIPSGGVCRLTTGTKCAVPRPDATRTTLYPQISLPMQSAAFYLTPKLGFHNTSYDIQKTDLTPSASVSRAVPIVSVDAGAFLERNVNWFGSSLIQTLEPRLYYLNVPERDQRAIPLFDTGIADFNFAQIFSENRYGGGDRIAEANQLTAMVSSRLISPDTGAELLRAGVGQRLYFKDQYVTLNSDYDPTINESIRPGRTTDYLAALSGLILPKTHLDTTVQYNPVTKTTDRWTMGVRYQPEIGKVLNAGYRYVRGVAGAPASLDQLDFSAQWPLANGWSGVGRYNYSLVDKRLIEALGGLEYSAGCWTARGIIQRTITNTAQTDTAFFFQLELSEFSKLGSNPLNLLKRSVPGYGAINSLELDPEFSTP